MLNKRKGFPLLLVILLMASGCATGNRGADPEVDRSLGGTETNSDQGAGNVDKNDVTSKLGYVRYKKDELNNDEESRQMVSIDRNKMADTITRMILRYDGFEEAATLVTDDEVLIAYHRPENMEREKAASIAKKTAMSLMPRYYDIVVSDKDVSFQEIQSLKNSSTLDDDYENTLRSIMESMKEAPQGEGWPEADVKDRDDDAMTE
ncbi:YhcN/YlaJ family sporulation lipoprotein [Sediminibacillus halophilus]|uniref:Sporulation lipoprotein YhcN/YlaJ (Spore_YhcN_YlaJ) n=1 Tax=Sediminibacillus halophilus TaxID=482461 RepID=A0A1G9QSU1_9BACI|nr:YhcN/YlaJ family sporulation lipoprotein [Sediminibacillus halophilus]SDM14043.1 Sporulation lipoprotein YhcN/YlaJ (Spore_YhcN_YlaJ) [Sediminibacillus halophilus]